MDLKSLVATVRDTVRLDQRIEAFRQQYGFPRESIATVAQEE